MLELHKRSVARKHVHAAARGISRKPRREKKLPPSAVQQEMHDASTGFQQMLEQWPQMLDPIEPAHYA